MFGDEKVDNHLEFWEKNGRGMDMSGIGDAIRYLYGTFILRDLLSFVTPGAIIVGSALLLKFDPSQDQILNFAKSIPLIVYLPIFGICYVVGFAIQCFGVRIGLITFFNPVDIPGGGK